MTVHFVYLSKVENFILFKLSASGNFKLCVIVDTKLLRSIYFKYIYLIYIPKHSVIAEEIHYRLQNTFKLKINFQLNQR